MARVGRRLLAISWAMPPAVFPRALQVSRTLAAMARHGWEVTVVCADAATIEDVTLDADLAHRYADAYRAIPVSLRERRPSWRALGRESEAMVVSLDELWEREARCAALDAARAEPFDLLVTFAQPWSDHRVGLALAATLSVPWVAHFSDPWVGSPYYAGLPAETLDRWREEERCVIQGADAVVFVTAETVDLVMGKYPADWRRKAHVVPHGYDRRLLPPAAPRDPRRFRIVQTGDFYGLRNPEALLGALARLVANGSSEGAGLEFISVGMAPVDAEERVRRLGLQEAVRFVGRRPVAETLALAASADALALVDADTTDSVFLPSKLIDYLMFRKPILGLTPAGSASAALLRRLGCDVVAPFDVDGIAAAVAGLQVRWHAGRLAPDPAFDAVAAGYDIERTAADFEAILVAAGASHRP